MIIRTITPEEYKRTRELSAIAFEYSIDNTKPALQMWEEDSRNSQKRDSLGLTKFWAAFEDDDTTMMSSMLARPYPARFDGHPVTMVGIGDVATLPPYRRRGGIRGCFAAALPDMYQSGAEFSYLYPFSTAYYRKFGYEMVGERVQYTLALNALGALPRPGGSCRLIEQGTSLLEEVKAVYTLWQNRYNFMIENGPYEYAWVGNANPAKDQQFSYVYYNEQGVPKGYLSMQLVLENAQRNLHCSRFVFDGAEGFYGLLHLAHSLSADHTSLVFTLPSSLDIVPLLPEWAGTCSRQPQHLGMLRAVNVHKVLHKAKYCGSGRMVLEVQDENIPQNNGVFTVEFANGAAEKVTSGGHKPDAVMPVQVFSRLISGGFTPASLEYMQGLDIRCTPEEFAKVFYPKPVMLLEYF